MPKIKLPWCACGGLDGKGCDKRVPLTSFKHGTRTGTPAKYYNRTHQKRMQRARNRKARVAASA